MSGSVWSGINGSVPYKYSNSLFTGEWNKISFFITRVDIVIWPPQSDLKADATVVHCQQAAEINHSGWYKVCNVHFAYIW